MSIVAALDCGTNSTRLLVGAARGREARHPRPPQHDHPARAGRRRHRPAGRRGHRAHPRRASAEYREVLDEHGVERVRIDGHVGRPRRRQPRRVLRRRRRGRRRAARAAVGRRRGTPVVPRRHRRPRPGPRPVPRRRHRRRIDRVHPRHRPTSRACCRSTWLRAADREVPRARSAAARGADRVHQLSPTPTSTTCCASIPGSGDAAHPRRPGRHDHHGRRRRDRARRPTTATRIHHFVLTRDAAEDVFRTLATESLADRIHNPGLEEARADVIVGGLLRARGDLAPLRLRRVPRVRGRHPRRPGAQPRCRAT